LQRSKRKKENKAKLAASRRDPNKKRGFRQVHIEGFVYQWRYYGDRVEIRPPGKLELKWMVPIWALHGETLEDWTKAHAECDGENCSAYAVSPGMVRDYILEMRKATC
jgi:hypothetical protein